MVPLVSIITVNYNAIEVTCEMLDSIRSNSYSNVEVIVVDNASSIDPSNFIYLNYPEVKFIRSNKNLGFAGGNNLGIQESTGDFLFFLNNDAELTNGVIEALLAVFDKFPRAGISSPKICFYAQPRSGHDVIQYAGTTNVHPLTARNSTLGLGEKDNGQFDEVKETAYANGAAMMVPKYVVDEVGMMPEEFFLYYEELDWCEQIRNAGFKVIVEPNVKVYHKESYSVNKVSSLKTYYMTRNRILFMRRNRSVKEMLVFWMFLFCFTVPKNTFKYVLKLDLENLKAFYKAISWNLQKTQEISPSSTPLTFKNENMELSEA